MLNGKGYLERAWIELNDHNIIRSYDKVPMTASRLFHDSSPTL